MGILGYWGFGDFKCRGPRDSDQNSRMSEQDESEDCYDAGYESHRGKSMSRINRIMGFLDLSSKKKFDLTNFQFEWQSKLTVALSCACRIDIKAAVKLLREIIGPLHARYSVQAMASSLPY